MRPNFGKVLTDFAHLRRVWSVPKHIRRGWKYQKTYVYDAANRMVKGVNLVTSEESAYVYNGQGNRVRTEQKIFNQTAKYYNNENSGGNGYSDFVKFLANENLTEDTPRTYEDNFGLTRQTVPIANVCTDYIIDYASRYGREIMTYESSGYETAYTYGAVSITYSNGDRSEFELSSGKIL